MRSRYFYIAFASLVFFMLVLFIPPAHGQSPTFILFKRALKASPILMAAQKGKEEAILRKEVEKRKGWPQVSFETNFTLYNTHNEATYRDQEFLTAMDLDIFGKHALRAKALETESIVAQGNLKAERWKIFKQVAKGYYRLAASLQEEHLANEQLKWALELYQKTQRLVKRGALSEVSLIRAEEGLQEARLEVENASKEKEMTLSRIKMWVPDFEIRPVYSRIPDPVPVKMDQSALLKALIRFSPQVASLKAKRERAFREARAERLSFLPDLKLRGGYVVHREENDTGDYWMWSAGISLPLFDGGVRKRKVKLKELKAEEIEFQMASLKRDLALKARTLITNLKSQYENWRLLKREAELCRGLAQKMFKAYSFGGIRIEELVRTTRKAREKELKLTEISCRYNYTRDMIGYIQQEGGKE